MNLAAAMRHFLAQFGTKPANAEGPAGDGFRRAAPAFVLLMGSRQDAPNGAELSTDGDVEFLLR